MRLTLPLLLWLPTAAQAHAIVWTETPTLLPALAYALVWGAYVLGARRCQPPRAWRAAFHAGMVVGAWSLFGPLDRWAERSTAWHMTQHMLLIGAVAPLLVMAAPLGAWRAVCGRWLDAPARAFVRAGRRPMACAALHAAAIWVWHAPGPYEAALRHEGWHWLAHASFLLSALLFWQATLRPGRTRALAAAMALLFTLMHTGSLGALLTFARVPLYPPDDLADQQLAGLVMWVPGGMVYLAAMVVLVTRAWLRQTGDAAMPAAAPAFTPPVASIRRSARGSARGAG